AEQCLDRVLRLFSSDERRALFDVAKQIAEATGQPKQREVQFLGKVAGKLGIPNLTASTTSSEPVRPLNPAAPSTAEERRAVLEINPALPLSADLVRRQFHLLSERYA